MFWCTFLTISLIKLLCVAPNEAKITLNYTVYVNFEPKQIYTFQPAGYVSRAYNVDLMRCLMSCSANVNCHSIAYLDLLDLKLSNCATLFGQVESESFLTYSNGYKYYVKPYSYDFFTAVRTSGASSFEVFASFFYEYAVVLVKSCQFSCSKYLALNPIFIDEPYIRGGNVLVKTNCVTNPFALECASLSECQKKCKSTNLCASLIFSNVTCTLKSFSLQTGPDDCNSTDSCQLAVATISRLNGKMFKVNGLIWFYSYEFLVALSNLNTQTWSNLTYYKM